MPRLTHLAAAVLLLASVLPSAARLLAQGQQSPATTRAADMPAKMPSVPLPAELERVLRRPAYDPHGRRVPYGDEAGGPAGPAAETGGGGTRP